MPNFFCTLASSLTKRFMITKIIDEDLIQEAKSLIENAENIVITTHVSPDGDAIGSSLALCNFLKTIGKEAYVVVPNDMPGFLKWMSGASDIIVYEKKKNMADALIEKADLICALDFNVLKRIENVAISVADSAAKKLMLDHHLNPGNFANVVISYPQFASTSEMVFRLICRMGYFTEMTKECAECIYTGMMTDTGGFTYNSNNPEVYIIISELIKKGIDKDAIYDKVYNNYSESRYRLMGYMLYEKMKIYPEYGAAMISLTNEELSKYDFKKGDTEGFVNMPLSIKGVIFSAFFKEEGGKIKCSFRSQGDVATNVFAEKYFNGGGHKNASGGESYQTMQETVAKFEENLPSLKEEIEAELKIRTNG